MEAFKVTQTSHSNKLTIEIPNHFISKKLEIIVFPFDEQQDNWKDYSLNSLNKAYSADEPEYNLNMVKEPYEHYGRR